MADVNLSLSTKQIARHCQSDSLQKRTKEIQMKTKHINHKIIHIHIRIVCVCMRPGEEDEGMHTHV